MRIIVIGAGEIGMPIIHYLSEMGNILSVIEKDEKRCKHIADHADAAIFKGSATNTRIWRSIEADKADALFVLTNNDENNMSACSIAKKQYGIPFIIARAHQPENIEKLKEAGADIVICPSLETQRLFLNALKGQYTETLFEKDKENFKLVMVNVPSNGSVIGKSLAELNNLNHGKIPAVFHNGGFEFPDSSFIFKAGDRVLVMGSLEAVNKATKKLMSTVET